ncbi:unnamed protein product [Leptosia nina]|uniref:Uncharacterized protein n=1 Tax=Leptosia nina TaxID=320188 RepID=A0AAV1ITK9_9NEOP
MPFHTTRALESDDLSRRTIYIRRPPTECEANILFRLVQSVATECDDSTRSVDKSHPEESTETGASHTGTIARARRGDKYGRRRAHSAAGRGHRCQDDGLRGAARGPNSGREFLLVIQTTAQRNELETFDARRLRCAGKRGIESDGDGEPVTRATELRAISIHAGNSQPSGWSIRSTASFEVNTFGPGASMTPELGHSSRALSSF